MQRASQELLSATAELEKRHTVANETKERYEHEARAELARLEAKRKSIGSGLEARAKEFLASFDAEMGKLAAVSEKRKRRKTSQQAAFKEQLKQMFAGIAQPQHDDDGFDDDDD